MKKSTLTAMALLCAASLTTPAFAQTSPTATDEIYDFSGFQDATILNLFYNALQNGRKYPTMAEFEAAGIQASDLAFVRSHVRKANLLSDADRINQNTTSGRDLWMNIPLGTSKEVGGYPSDVFNNDVYSMWQYTNLFGSWNHGIFQAPGVTVDAAHRNGTDIFSGIKFFEGWNVDSGSYIGLITKKDGNGDFMYVKPLINAMMFFGSDGVNYNWEDSGYSNSDITAFHKALYKEAAAQGFTNFHAGIYTPQNMMTVGTANALFGNSEGRTFDLMLNYSGGDFTSSSAMQMSVNAAKSAMGTTEGLYTGVWIAGMSNRSWSNLTANPEINACLWGEHAQSRFFSNSRGTDSYDRQRNYQRLLETGFSGDNHNPANLPALGSFKDWDDALQGFAGLATWFPERSGIQGDLHFLTHFTLGNGDRYYYKGKQARSGQWYNMGAQDLVPTYRWLVYNAGTTTVSNDIEPDYTFKDAYTGGSALELNGKATASGTDIVLYKTALTVKGSKAFANIAVKNLKEGVNPSNLYLIVKVKGQDSFKEFAFGDVDGATWQEKKIDLGGLANGDVVERIGLRVKGSDDNYNILVGKLELNCSSLTTPANVTNLKAEVKQETKESLTAKLYWDTDATAKDRADWGLVYNDEANIHHFEVLYKSGAEGKAVEVARTSSWSALVPNIKFESVDEVPYIGVRAVSTDLQTYSPTVWLKIDRAEQSALPDYVAPNTYGYSALDPESDGAEIALSNRWLEKVSTTGADQNINYVATEKVPAEDNNHVDANDQVLKVSQGQEISLTFKAANLDDGMKYCFGGCWIDFDGSGDYNHTGPMPGTSKLDDETYDELGERVFRCGALRAGTDAIQTTGMTYKFTIPADATPGSSRLRIVFSDAWFAGSFIPDGLLNKGYSIDFPVVISGSNPGRTSVNTRDQGEAEEPILLEGGSTKIDNATANGASDVEFADGSFNFKNVEKAWIYTADGKFVSFLRNNPTSVSAEGFAPGVYLVKMESDNVVRSQKVVIK